MKHTTVLIAAFVVAAVSPALAQEPHVDPLTAKVDVSDAQRFAKLWSETRGKPTAAQIQERYLDEGGRGVTVFTPNRIQSAQRLATKIAEQPQVYRDAVGRCLPWIDGTNAQLRATYLGLRGLFPDRPLPEIAVVVGGNNSGGTAAPGIQVIGLEVICRLSPTRAEFEDRMRQFFAHETVHTFQGDSPSAEGREPLIAAALREGVPDYIAKLVTARVPNPERHEWAMSRERWVWQQFLADAIKVRAGSESGETSDDARAAFRRWFANAGDAPPGWPDELGYWVGMRIAEAYVAQSPDARPSLDNLLEPEDPAAILQQSGYGKSFPK
jgi:hypothetical protein